MSLICEEFSKRKLFSIFHSVYMNEGEIERYSMTCDIKIYPEETVLLGGFMKLCVMVIMHETDRRRVLGRSGCSSFRRAESKNLTMLLVSETERMCSAWNYGLETQRASGRVHPAAEAAITKYSQTKEVKCLNLILSQVWRPEGHDQVTVLQ